jgi:hypothetical protein
MNPWKGVVSGLQMFHAFCFLPMTFRIVRYGYPFVCDARHARDRWDPDDQFGFPSLSLLREPLLVGSSRLKAHNRREQSHR